MIYGKMFEIKFGRVKYLSQTHLLAVHDFESKNPHALISMAKLPDDGTITPLHELKTPSMYFSVILKSTDSMYSTKFTICLKKKNSFLIIIF